MLISARKKFKRSNWSLLYMPWTVLCAAGTRVARNAATTFEAFELRDFKLDDHPDAAVLTVRQVLAHLRSAGIQAGRTTVAEIFRIANGLRRLKKSLTGSFACSSLSPIFPQTPSPPSSTIVTITIRSCSKRHPVSGHRLSESGCPTRYPPSRGFPAYGCGRRQK